jgi:hypothetical protein
MHSARQFIFPGAIISSLILASFGYTVMARVPSDMVNSKPQATISSEADSADSNTSGNIDGQELSKGTNDAGENKCKIHPGFPEKIRQWCTQIMRHSKKNNLDPNLVAALIWQESGGNPAAYSKSGAVGLMQIMPHDGIAASFQCPNGPCFINRPSISELQRPNFNIKFGTAMLAGLFNKYGDMREALRYYGPKDVGYYYADKVLGIFNTHSG